MAVRLAGIMAAKRTAELIFLCHPLPLTHVDVRKLKAAPSRIKVSTNAQTGVEMEASQRYRLSATIYDMQSPRQGNNDLGRAT